MPAGNCALRFVRLRVEGTNGKPDKGKQPAGTCEIASEQLDWAVGSDG